MSVKLSGKSPGSKKKENTSWSDVDGDLRIPAKFMPIFNRNCQEIGRHQATQELIQNYSLGCGFCYLHQLYAKVQLIKQSGI